MDIHIYYLNEKCNIKTNKKFKTHLFIVINYESLVLGKSISKSRLWQDFLPDEYNEVCINQYLTDFNLTRSHVELAPSRSRKSLLKPLNLSNALDICFCSSLDVNDGKEKL